jgi:hypothetical protein
MLKHAADIVFSDPRRPCPQTFQREVKLTRESDAVLFVLREAEQLQNGDPTRQRFSDVPHHHELLGAGQPKTTRFLGLVAHDFYLAEKLGCILHLVDDNRRLVGLEKQHRVALGEVSRHKVVERDVCAPLPLGQVAEHRGLPDLTRPCDKYGFEEPAHTEEFALQRPVDVVHVVASFLYDSITKPDATERVDGVS